MSPRPRTTLIIAVIAQAAVSVVQFGLPAIGVDIQNTFGLGPAGFGAVFAAVGLGSAVALIPAGMLVDRFGARPVLLTGATINFCAYLAASVAPNAALFAAAIFLAGIGSSAVPVAGMSSLLREFPPERRGIALGWRQLAVPMGGAIGAAALPLLAHVGGVRLALIVTAFATASTAGRVRVAVGRRRRHRPAHAAGRRAHRPRHAPAAGGGPALRLRARRGAHLHRRRSPRRRPRQGRGGRAVRGAEPLGRSIAAGLGPDGRPRRRHPPGAHPDRDAGCWPPWRGWRWRRCCTSASCWPCPSPSRSASAALAGTACCTSPPASWSAPTGPHARWAWHRRWCSVPARCPHPSRGWWPSTPATT